MRLTHAYLWVAALQTFVLVSNAGADCQKDIRTQKAGLRLLEAAADVSLIPYLESTKGES